MRSINFILLFVLISTNALAGTADPSGVAGLILVAIVVAPLAILALIGAAIGGIRGAAVGVVIFFAGLIVFLYPAYRRSEQHDLEAKMERFGSSDACLRESGEVGEPIRFPYTKVLVHIDPKLKDYWNSLKFPMEDAPLSTEYVSSIPEKRLSREVLVELRLIDRAIEGAGTHRLRGFETKITDSTGKLIGMRTNTDSCLSEREERAIERFLRRMLGAQHVLLTSIKQAELIPIEYPIGTVSAPEKGHFTANPAIRTGDLKTIVPSEWGCKFDKGIGGPDPIKCPDRADILVYDQTLQRAAAIFDTDGTWIVLFDPSLTNNGNRGFLNRTLLEQRDRKGQPIRHLLVRFPRIDGAQSFSLADVKISSDRMELYLVTKRCPISLGSLKYEGCERFRLSFPVQKISEPKD